MEFQAVVVVAVVVEVNAGGGVAAVAAESREDVGDDGREIRPALSLERTWSSTDVNLECRTESC